MAEDVADKVGHVLGQHVGPAAHERQSAGRLHEVDRRARARAERKELRDVLESEALRVARRGGELHDVLGDRRVDEPAPALALQRAQLLGRGHRGDAGLGDAGDAVDDHELLFLGGVADQHFHHEAVDLRLRERVGALGLDRVLRRHHQERLGHAVRLARDRDLILLHHFEKRALHLGGRAVDLVGEQQVREHGPERGGELAGLLVVDAGADEVGRDEVGRELDALERALQGPGHRLHGERLREAGHAFDQKVALREHRDHHALEEAVLPDDDLLDLVEDPLHDGRALGAAGVVCVHARLLLVERFFLSFRTAAGRRPRRRSRSAPRSRCR